MGRLEHKVATITGAGSGIGEATAIRFGAEGAAVVVADINGPAAAAVADSINAAGGRAIAVVTDVADEAAVAAMIAQTVDAFGRIDILFNNALNTADAYAPSEQDLLKFDTAIFDRIVRVNVLGGILACKYAIPHMQKQGGGSILFTSSISAMGGDVAQYSYGRSKAMVNWYVQTIATSYGKANIRCNGIAPGMIRTPAVRQWATEDMNRAFLDLVQLPRLGEPEDIAALALFLASDEAGYITGQIYVADGGITTPVPFVQMQRAEQAKQEKQGE